MQLVASAILVLFSIQWIRETTAYSCKVQYTPGIVFNCCRLNKEFVAATAEECLARCNEYNSKKQPNEYWCLRINWYGPTKQCSLLYTTEANANDPSLQLAHGSYISATLYDCTTNGYYPTTPSPWPPVQTPPPQPGYYRGVGCGRQASQYQPYIPSKRIIGGTEAVRHSWPWQVSLRTSKPGQDWHFCGGTLVRVHENVEESDLVLTAAHCVTAEPKVGLGNMSDWTVVAGTHTRSIRYTPGEERRRIVDFQYPKEFKDLINDVAIVRLDRPIRFSDTIRPICLPRQNDPVPTGRLCMASGWGRNDSKAQTQQDELKQTLTPIHPVEFCQKNWYWQKEAWSYAFLCAGALDASSATCNGDSGGPVVCKMDDGSWSQYGIASFVSPNGCATANMPPVFSRVPTYSNWIRQTINSMSAILKGAP